MSFLHQNMHGIKILDSLQMYIIISMLARSDLILWPFNSSCNFRLFVAVVENNVQYKMSFLHQNMHGIKILDSLQMYINISLFARSDLILWPFKQLLQFQAFCGSRWKQCAVKIEISLPKHAWNQNSWLPPNV